ncbi:hypothetical protein GJV26_25170 [Massilia dura]|uniref:Uncharacterized protein n=1 Tax=Pseudoduganella dura TaxID=321982 RepID=A0A6I3XMF3_9BURK|nr:hypothetical protein [Pseudoduganella dura]MUI15720.1 hypothetical protein [Pseudoduganella dura]GGX88893.1 hypothetical protein GCM10007386_19580 [Pseudoduganella dura]
MVNLILHPGAARRPLFIVRDGNLPLLFGVDGAGRLRMLQHMGAGAWSDTDLSAALPAAARVCCADVRQAPDGTIGIALAIRHGAGDCTLHIATGLAAGQDEAGWLEAMRQLAPVPGLPAGTQVTRLAFGPLQAGAPPLLLITAGSASWYCNAAAPMHTLRTLHLPAAQAYAIGNYRQPGIWALHPYGKGSALRFTPLRDPFGWYVALDYPEVPAHTHSVLLAPGSMPNVPDLYAAGDRIVVYRGGNTQPQTVAQVAGARLVWSHAREGAEYLAFADADGALWMVIRPYRGTWNPPFLLTRRRAVLAVAGQFIHAAVIEEGRLQVQRFTMDGLLYSSEIVTVDW